MSKEQKEILKKTDEELLKEISGVNRDLIIETYGSDVNFCKIYRDYIRSLSKTDNIISIEYFLELDSCCYF